MAIERTIGSINLVDILDRVLDKGLVIEALLQVRLVGIDLLAHEARVVVMSFESEGRDP